ncbi:trimeric intracellular cation channel family protein [Kiritimatiellota bacterium B12222]|nr:trimeric intracellular cation channel family protein [Kiritimatiellota bacterium B12222]
MDLTQFSYWIGMAGITAFAVTAVLALATRQIDLFSAVVLGIITAVGGGTLRDLILDEPVFWLSDITYIWVAMIASLIAFWAEPLLTRKEIHSLLLYVDGFGVAMFSIATINKVWNLGYGLPLAPIILGIVTAIGGGLLRDVLAGRPTLLTTTELYATPVLLGCTLYVGLIYLLPDHRLVSAISCGALIFGIRAAAIHWHLTVPSWLITKMKQNR